MIIVFHEMSEPYVCIFEIECCCVFRKNVVYSFGIKMTFWKSLI